jgi:hypothetical protein
MTDDNASRWAHAYGGKYHNAAEHGPNRQQFAVEVVDAKWGVIENKMQGTADDKIIVWFRDVQTGGLLKPFPLNKTNAQEFETATGSQDPNSYFGLRCSLNVVDTSQGPGCRVRVNGRSPERAFAPQQQPRQPTRQQQQEPVRYGNPQEPPPEPGYEVGQEDALDDLWQGAAENAGDQEPVDPPFEPQPAPAPRLRPQGGIQRPQQIPPRPQQPRLQQQPPRRLKR